MTSESPLCTCAGDIECDYCEVLRLADDWRECVTCGEEFPDPTRKRGICPECREAVSVVG